MGDEFTAHGARAIVIANIQDEKGHRYRHDVIVIALQSRQSLSLSFLVAGCFDCCWLADFG